MRVVILGLLCWTGASCAWADGQTQQLLHEVRTRSHLLCSSAMLYFNPDIQSPDHRALASYFDNLARLQTRTVQLGQPATMVAYQRDLQAMLKSLEQLPKDSSAQYPGKISRLLQLHHQADAWAEQQYRLETPDADISGLHSQSLNLAKMLLDYQERSYPMPGEEGRGMNTAELAELDLAINERFGDLINQSPDSAATIAGIRKNYRFVRSMLLDTTEQRASGGIEFYLARSIVDLDELAALRLAEVDMAQGEAR